MRAPATLLLCVAAIGGCAARSPAPAADTGAAPPATTRAVGPVEVPSVATLRLDQILPAARFPTTRPTAATSPTTSPSGADRPPIEALLLYGQAVDHLNSNRRLAAVELLEQAATLDPASFELQYALGRAYSREGATPDPRSLEPLERAERMNPDHLRLQTELGRIHAALGDEEKALWHLRLALATRDYATDQAGAAVAEMMLMRALSREGYHTAAIEVYERLAARLENPPAALRADPEIAFLIARPELLRLRAAESYEKIGRFDKALTAYREASQRDAGSIELTVHVVRALLGLRRLEEAAVAGADAVARSRASAPSLALLREVADAHGTGGPVELLIRLRREKPRDRTLAFALADVLRSEGRAVDAGRVLRETARARPGDPEAVRRLFESERDASPGGAGAAHFLIDWSANYPDSVHLLGNHWDHLLSAAGERSIGLLELRALQPGPDASPRWGAAKDFWVAHVARLRHRRDVARRALRSAAEARPTFPPALRAWAGWDRQDLGLTAAERNATVERFAAAAEAGDPALAEELRGMLRLTARDFAGARENLTDAVGKFPSPPERQFALAVAARGMGDEAAFEQILWRVAGDSPGFEDAYEALYAFYDGRDAEDASARVLTAWLDADPASVPARIIHVREQLRAGRVAAAQAMALRLFTDQPGDPRVLAVLRAICAQGTRSQLWLQIELQKRHDASPGNLAIASHLVDFLINQGKTAEAARVLDATRAAVAHDPDRLYEIAHLYERVGQKATTERVLTDLLALEAGHAPAANDLGYSMAEDGRELARAEELLRVAVDAEPANASFLDSLGWVLYKRGRLEEALRHLERSIASGKEESASDADAGPDPVVLDHLGDTVYRLGNRTAAGSQWERAAKGLANLPASQRDRDDLKQLRLQLDRKRRQLKAGQPVSTAPIIETPRATTRRAADVVERSTASEP